MDIFAEHRPLLVEVTYRVLWSTTDSEHD
jgi:hypothetical protein